MPFSTRKAALAAAAAFGLLALAACGGGGGGGGTPQTSRVTLPEGHSVASGRFTVAAGKSVDRGGVRFSCAAGGAACAVVVDTGSGQARVTGGRLTVARVPAATGGQDGGTPPEDGGTPPEDGGTPPEAGQIEEPWPDWPIQDVAAARARTGSNPLSRSSNDISSHIKTQTYHTGSNSRGVGHGSNSRVRCVAIEDCGSDDIAIEYRSVMEYRSIPIAQVRFLDVGKSTPGNPGSVWRGIGIVGLLNHGFFTVESSWERPIGESSAGGNYAFEAAFRDDRSNWQDYGGPRELPLGWLPAPLTGRWSGALVGIGDNASVSSLYRQFIMGDVDITVKPSPNFPSSRPNVDVEFSNIYNVNTGESVTLSRTQWNDLGGSNGMGTRSVSSPGIHDGSPGSISMDFLGTNTEEVLGVFRTEGARGAFGAKKQ